MATNAETGEHRKKYQILNARDTKLKNQDAEHTRTDVINPRDPNPNHITRN